MINNKTMEHINKTITYVLDSASGATFLFGAITGHDLIMVLGGMASVAAMINHTSQWLERREKRKQKNN